GRSGGRSTRTAACGSAPSATYSRARVRRRARCGESVRASGAWEERSREMPCANLGVRPRSSHDVAGATGMDAGRGGRVTGGKVLLAAPRSFCAGVDRAIEIVERLIEQHGPPVYVRHQIVHNDNVVRRLEELGAVFVEDENEIPAGAICVLSAHGVAPAVKESCRERGLQVVDATCPL